MATLSSLMFLFRRLGLVQSCIYFISFQQGKSELCGRNDTEHGWLKPALKSTTSGHFQVSRGGQLFRDWRGFNTHPVQICMPLWLESSGLGLDLAGSITCCKLSQMDGVVGFWTVIYAENTQNPLRCRQWVTFGFFFNKTQFKTQS